MTERTRRIFLSLLLALFASFGTARAAHAAGSVKATPPAIEEVEGQWRLKLDIDYGAMPDIQFVPFIFSFEPVVLYELSLTDESGEKPVLNKKQLQNQPAINESTDVGFSDGTGKFFRVTKFGINLRRDRGFEAGEYMLTLKKADDGKQLGQKVRITLNGKNKVVDRRSISFVGDDGKKKKDKPADPPKGDEPKGDAPKGDEPKPEGSGEGSAGSGDGSASGEPEVAPVDKGKGGCNCEVGTARDGAGPLGVPALAGLLLSATLLRRRRGGPKAR